MAVNAWTHLSFAVVIPGILLSAVVSYLAAPVECAATGPCERNLWLFYIVIALLVVAVAAYVGKIIRAR